jgi:hypothetical protein
MKEEKINVETTILAFGKNYPIGRMIHYNNDMTIKNVEYTYVPTQAILQKWLREKYHIHVTPRESYAFDKTLEYVCTVNDIYVSHNNPKLPINRFPTWEEALEIGLQEGLKLIKEKE